MQLIESERARAISFSKRKKTLFQDAEKLATRSGDEVGVMLFSPGEKPFSYGSTSIEEIIDKFLKVKLEQRDHAEGKSVGFGAFKDLRKELQELNEKERRRILMYKIMHPGSEIPSDKHMEEKKVAMLLWVKEILNETKSAILSKHFKFDLNVLPEPEEHESS
uniref:Agamous-like MADS-box protein AGL61 n=2 Tax=Solanum tuberosum TaxID=4113 RepID=M1DM11_SOLTU